MHTNPGDLVSRIGAAQPGGLPYKDAKPDVGVAFPGRKYNRARHVVGPDAWALRDSTWRPKPLIMRARNHLLQAVCAMVCAGPRPRTRVKWIQAAGTAASGSIR